VSLAHRILISDALHPEAMAWLKEQAEIEVDVRPEITKEELLEAIGGYEALIVRSRTRVDAQIIERGRKLRVIGRAGTGLDNIDLEAARRAGIAVLNTPGANANAVAELTIGLIIALARRLPEAFSSDKKPKSYGWELKGKTLGIIGLGRIGSGVARLAHAFGMRLLGYDIIAEAGPKGLEIARVDLKKLLVESDVISLHVPLTDDTKHMINAEALSVVKEGTFLVNTARAEVVDEAELLKALDEGKIAGYATDLCKDERLRAHPKVICTPHIGAQTKEAQRRAGLEIAERVAAMLRGEEMG